MGLSESKGFISVRFVAIPTERLILDQVLFGRDLNPRNTQPDRSVSGLPYENHPPGPPEASILYGKGKLNLDMMQTGHEESTLTVHNRGGLTHEE